MSALVQRSTELNKGNAYYYFLNQVKKPKIMATTATMASTENGILSPIQSNAGVHIRFRSNERGNCKRRTKN